MNHHALIGLAVSLWLSTAAATPEPVAVRQWEFIVIHHSATDSGSAARFDEAHRARGMINGLAYHFVIDNGTDGRPDGYIETGLRWMRQMHGGHCRQAHINEKGIGICLVGNFSRSRPTPKQLDSLALLIRGLQEQFGIADDQILAHGEIFGERSECPGINFPWDELNQRLKSNRR